MTVRAVYNNMAIPGVEHSVFVVSFGLKVGAPGFRSVGGVDVRLELSFGWAPFSQMEVWCFPRHFLHLLVDWHSLLM